MRITIGNPYIGNLTTSKLLAYDSGIPERRGTMAGTIDGETVHQISEVKESDRKISAPVLMNQTQADMLKSLHLATLDTTGNQAIHTWQDGENVYHGYLKSLGKERRPVKGLFRFDIIFHVTEKIQ